MHIANLPSRIYNAVQDPLYHILSLFVITQFLGIYCGILLITSSLSNPDVQLISIAPTGQADDLLNAVIFIAYILAGAGIALFLIRFFKHKIAFNLLEFAMLTGSVSIVFLSIFIGVFNFDFFDASAISAALGFAFSVLKFFNPSIKNLAAVLSSSGIAALFGFSVGFWPTLIFVLAVSLYDYIAVFKTRHMLQLAQHLGSRDLSFTITAQRQNSQISKIKKEGASASSIASNSAALKPPLSKNDPSLNLQAADRLDLGSGDLVVPAMFAVSSYPFAGIAGSIAIAIGCTIALFLTLKFVIQKHVALPALPPLCLGGVLSLLFLLFVQALVA
jgi:presenilin-like A22 family membrane protease